MKAHNIICYVLKITRAQRTLKEKIVDAVRYQVEPMTGNEIAEYLNLQPIFQAILGETIK